MSIKRWEPFRDIFFEENFIRPVGRWLMEAWDPAIDMYETKDSVVIKASVPGVKPEEIDISITGDTLTISGEVKQEETVEKENYYRRERRYGSISRAIALPVAVKADMAEAVFENGILTLTLPKAEEAKPRTIKVKPK